METVKLILDFLRDLLKDFPFNSMYWGIIFLLLLRRGDIGKLFGKIKEFFGKVSANYKQKFSAHKLAKGK